MFYNESKMSMVEHGQLKLFSHDFIYTLAVRLYDKPEAIKLIEETQSEHLEAWIGAVAVSPEDLLTT